MAEHKTKLQSNVNWLETFKMGRKAPAVANRIFLTLADAQLYVDDLYDSATEGIRITVLKDYTYVPDVKGRKYGDRDYVETTENGDYSGLYYVKSIGDGENPGVLSKICRGNVAWFKGTTVGSDGSSMRVRGAEAGDMFMNTNTLDIFTLGSDGRWRLVGNIGMSRVDREVPYYKLSTDGTAHPEWSAETWTRGNADGTNIPDNYEDYGASQVYLWTRFYSEGESVPKYTVSLVHSSLSLGTFTI